MHAIVSFFSKKVTHLTISMLLLMVTNALGQTGTIKGTVYNAFSNEPIPFAAIAISNTTIGTTSDINGEYEIANLQPGYYNLLCSFVGFEKQMQLEVAVSNAKPTILNFVLKETSLNLAEVTIKQKSFPKKEESPLSLRSISATEIYRNPGGNRDISKVIQSLPGVGSTASFRNDILVRGGAPNENTFFLDGIEIPTINHFATQGSSGGPVGIINVNLIDNVDFYAGAFPAQLGGALSSMMYLQLKEGNNEKWFGSATVGSSDIGLTMEGPISKKATLVASIRRSYLQVLFKALALPFLPTYNDFQAKSVIKFNNKNKLTLIGIGALDDFELNEDVNTNETDAATIRRNNYLLSNLPINTQWNYTIGGRYQHFGENNLASVFVSRSHLNNASIKYKDNQESNDNLLLDYQSQEVANKVRFENLRRKKNGKWVWGAGLEQHQYSNSTKQSVNIGTSVSTVNYSSQITWWQYALFTQYSQFFLANRLLVSAGIRTDFNSYSKTMMNPINQLSPRVSLSYTLSEKTSLNANVGKYTQLPPKTALGFKNNDGELVNKKNNLDYIHSNHYVLGLAHEYNTTTQFTLEGFYKMYTQYPLSIQNGVSLANLGADFGVIGAEALQSISKGKSYGLEFLAQKKLSQSFYGILSYTWVKSKFTNADGKFIPSSWDNRHILNITAGKKWKKNWELGLKFRFLGGAPYTPYDIATSSQKEVWDARQQGVLDWSNINSRRLQNSHGMDVRLDKKWFFQKWSLNAYLDIQNVYNFQFEAQPYLDLARNEDGSPQTSSTNSNQYVLEEIPNTSGTLLPSIGLQFDF